MLKTKTTTLVIYLVQVFLLAKIIYDLIIVWRGYPVDEYMFVPYVLSLLLRSREYES